MYNFNTNLVLVLVFLTFNLFAQDTKRTPKLQKVESSTTIKNLPQRVQMQSIPKAAPQNGDAGFKKSTEIQPKSAPVMETQKEFTTEEKAMIQHRETIKSGGFYNSRVNIEKRKKAILQNYLGLDSIDDPAYPAKKQWLAEQYPEKYEAFQKEMNSVTITKTSK